MRTIRGPLLVLLGLVTCVATAQADRSSGVWSGAVEARGNYYWETSTRVVAPEVRVEAESPDGVRVNGSYLVDTITSASQAAGVRVDVRFTEVRHDVRGGLGYEFDLGDAHLDLSGRVGVSYEPDYTSLGGGLAAKLSLFDRQTELSLGVNYLHDIIGKKLRGANRVGEDGRDLSDRGTVGSLDALALSFGMTQVITPVLTVAGGYDLGIIHGFQANAYRMVNVGGTLQEETHPDDRLRHAGWGRIAYFFRPTNTAFHLQYRAYLDSWDIAALNPEARLYQHVGEQAMVRLRYRFYTQRRAYFQQAEYETGAELFTADPKMTDFHSHLLGAKLLLHLDFLDQTPLDFAWDARLEFAFDYIWNTNRYGNGIIAQAGLRVPF